MKNMSISAIDDLVSAAVFGSDSERSVSRDKIRKLAFNQGIFPASTHNLYIARGEGEIEPTFTVPAFNLRGLTFDLASTIFSVAKEKSVGTFILEIARSEMEYTQQDPAEFAAVALAAASSVGWEGPVFLQADHSQFRTNPDGSVKETELDSLRSLIKETVSSGFYNIDIDASTLVNLDAETVVEQQKANIRHTLELAKFVRAIEPGNTTISIGGEIGHIGGVNSTVEDFRAFMDGFLSGWDYKYPGLSKVSVQTGTSHGGVVSKDGTLIDVSVDFSVLENISQIARKEYSLAGAVQHGASTLPMDILPRFPAVGTAEIHLATGLQNLIFDHPAFPVELKKRLYSWIDKEMGSERKKDWTTDQFYYSLRKKTWGHFKKDLWQMDPTAKAAILDSFAAKVRAYFDSLHVVYTSDMVMKYALA